MGFLERFRGLLRQIGLPGPVCQEGIQTSLFDRCLGAISRGDVSGLVTLVRSDVSVLRQRDPERRTLLLNACFPRLPRADTGVIKALLDLGADPCESDYMGLSGLHGVVMMDAVERPQPVGEVATLLLSAGLAVDAVDGYGNTPLWRAVMGWRPGRSFDVVESLLSLGADMDVKNRSGFSARDVVAENDGKEALAEHLGVARRVG